MNKKPLPTIGVDKYTFFKVNEDSVSGTEYGEAYNLKGTVEIAPTDSGGSDVFDADNGAYEASSYIEKLGHDITNADIPPEVDAMWRGLTRKNGVVEVGNDVKTVYFGVAWRILKSDGSYRYVRYYKGSYSFASNVGGKTKPSSGSIEDVSAHGRKPLRQHTRRYNVILTTIIMRILMKAICRQISQEMNLKTSGLRI